MEVASSGAVAQSGENHRFAARVPYPEGTYSLLIEIDDPESDETLTSEFSPTAQQLRFLVDRIPDAGFRKPEQRRSALKGKVSAIRNQIDAQAFRGAARKNKNDLISSFRRLLNDEHEAAANEYTKAEAINVAEDVHSRMETLAQQ